MQGNREIWRSIDGYSNYEVSTHGRVRNATTDRILKPGLTSGYSYVNLYLNGVQKTFSIHRLVANEFIDNPDNLPIVDHIDTNKTNNHISNLRWCDARQNQGNRLKQSPASSIYKGVYWNKKDSKWMVRISINRKATYLGLFTDEIEAAKKYDEHAKIEFGEFAKLNFPEE